MSLLGTIVLIVLGLFCGAVLTGLYVALLNARAEGDAVRRVNKDLQQSALEAEKKAQLSEMSLKSFEALVGHFAQRPVQVALTDDQINKMSNLIGMYVSSAMGDPKKLN